MWCPIHNEKHKLALSFPNMPVLITIFGQTIGRNVCEHLLNLMLADDNIHQFTSPNGKINATQGSCNGCFFKDLKKVPIGVPTVN